MRWEKDEGSSGTTVEIAPPECLRIITKMVFSGKKKIGTCENLFSIQTR